MGLEIAEIIMDIEDEFCIEIEEDARLDGTVGQLENYVISKFNFNVISKVIDLIPENDESGYIPHEAYAKLYNKYSWLPTPKRIIFFKKKLNKHDICEYLLSKEKYKNNSDLIRNQIRTIIKEQLQLSFDIEAKHHLVKDLGCS